MPRSRRNSDGVNPTGALGPNRAGVGYSGRFSTNLVCNFVDLIAFMFLLICDCAAFLRSLINDDDDHDDYSTVERICVKSNKL